MSPRRAFREVGGAIADALMDSADLMICVTDLEGRLLAANAGVEAAAGRPLAALLGNPIWDVLQTPDDEPELRQALASLRLGTPAFAVENSWLRPDGSLRSSRWLSLPIRDAAGAVSGGIAIGSRTSVHEALRSRAVQAEERFQLFESAVEEVFYISDLAAGKLSYASPGFERLWERPVDELLADVHRFLERVHPEDREIMQRALQRQLRGERTEEEYRLLFPDGRIRWIRDRSYPVVDANGRVVMVAGVASDVTSHRAAIERLADREQLLSAVFNRSTHALWLMSPDGLILEVNETGRSLVEHTAGSPFTGLPWATDADRQLAQTLQQSALNARLARADVAVRATDGSVAVLDVSVQPVQAAGATRYLLAEALDITQRLKERRARDEAEHRLALAIEATSEGVWDWNLENGTAFFSPRWCRNLGYPPKAIAPQITSWCALIHPEEHDSACETVRELMRGTIDTLRLDVRLRMANGEWFWSLTRGRIVERDANGIPLRIVGTDTDIGPLKQVEARIRTLNESLEDRVRDRTEALAKASRAKDEFLAVMSHELRTPLTAILGVADSVAEGIYGPVSNSQIEVLGLLQGSGQHLLDLIGDLLDLAKLDAGRLPVQFVDTDVRTLVRDVERLVLDMIHKRTQILDVRVPVSLDHIEVDPVRVRQILINVLTNASKFSPVGARISLVVTTTAAAISFLVRDEGPGIRYEHLSRLFRPFEQLDMQLARQYGGVGLGLALVQRLTALHRGCVSVECPASGGTNFTITIPKTTLWPQPADRRSGAVLLVGEGDAGRARLVEWLQQVGFTVGVAVDVTEALARIQFAPVDVLMIDAEAAPLDLIDIPQLQHLNTLIIMTVVTAPWRETMIEAFGADAVVEAPIEPAALLRALDRRGQWRG